MLKVLQQQQQIDAARSELRRCGASAMDPWPLAWRWGRKLGLLSGMAVGDRVKSWDVLQSLQFLESALPRDAAILDIGAFASEMPVALHRRGFTRVAAVDLNPSLGNMPAAGAIDYRVSDFMATPFSDGTFAAVTSVSVIEHGYQPERLLGEVSRLLQPGGYFLASFDYWPDKIDTRDTRFFGMDWLIFSADDVRDLIGQAAAYGLEPVGELQTAADAAVIHCGGKDYTFAWLVLRKGAAVCA